MVTTAEKRGAAWHIYRQGVVRQVAISGQDKYGYPQEAATQLGIRQAELMAEKLVGPRALYSYFQSDGIVRRMDQIVLRAQIPLSGLDRSVAQY